MNRLTNPPPGGTHTEGGEARSQQSAEPYLADVIGSRSTCRRHATVFWVDERRFKSSTALMAALDTDRLPSATPPEGIEEFVAFADGS